MKKTILITGCSSGFGLETAKYFAAREWDVIATMRTPRELPGTRVLPLDVTDARSIEACVIAAGEIDALVNNAGVGLLSITEATPPEAIRHLYETNLFGPIALARAFLPSLRARKGVIVNVSSTVTVSPLPMLGLYTASKAALNAWTECLALELAPLGVRARLVLPGLSPETEFGTNARAAMAKQGVTIPPAYEAFANGAFAALGAAREQGDVTRASEVAEVIWKAVTEPSAPIHQHAGADAVKLPVKAQ